MEQKHIKIVKTLMQNRFRTHLQKGEIDEAQKVIDLSIEMGFGELADELAQKLDAMNLSDLQFLTLNYGS